METCWHQDFDPWVRFQPSSDWQYLKPNAVINPNFKNPVHHSATVVLPAHVYHHGEITSACSVTSSRVGTSNELAHLEANAHTFDRRIVPSSTNANPNVHPAFTQSVDLVDTGVSPVYRRRFIIFDQAGNTTVGNATRFRSTSVTPVLRPSLDIKGKQPNYHYLQEKPPLNNHLIEDENHLIKNKSFQTSISQGCEMSENTEEIDALLYSESEDKEDVSTGRYSPVTTSEAEEEVASSGVVPTKKRRLNNESDDTDPLMDTASSANFHAWKHAGSTWVDRNAELNVVRETAKFKVGNTNGFINGKDKSTNENIHETLDALRRIIPGGGEGKDAAGVLDEAILYLVSLKTKVFDAIL